MYLRARSWEIQPGEFWAMTMGEWFVEYEWRRESEPTDYAGNLTRGDVEDLAEDLELSDDEWWTKNGNPSRRN